MPTYSLPAARRSFATGVVVTLCGVVAVVAAARYFRGPAVETAGPVDPSPPATALQPAGTSVPQPAPVALPVPPVVQAAYLDPLPRSAPPALPPIPTPPPVPTLLPLPPAALPVQPPAVVIPPAAPPVEVAAAKAPTPPAPLPPPPAPVQLPVPPTIPDVPPPPGLDAPTPRAAGVMADAPPPANAASPKTPRSQVRVEVPAAAAGAKSVTAAQSDPVTSQSGWYHPPTTSPAGTDGDGSEVYVVTVERLAARDRPAPPCPCPFCRMANYMKVRWAPPGNRRVGPTVSWVAPPGAAIPLPLASPAAALEVEQPNPIPPATTGRAPATAGVIRAGAR